MVSESGRQGVVVNARMYISYVARMAVMQCCAGVQVHACACVSVQVRTCACVNCAIVYVCVRVYVCACVQQHTDSIHAMYVCIASRIEHFSPDDANYSVRGIVEHGIHHFFVK